MCRNYLFISFITALPFHHFIQHTASHVSLSYWTRRTFDMPKIHWLSIYCFINNKLSPLYQIHFPFCLLYSICGLLIRIWITNEIAADVAKSLSCVFSIVTFQADADLSAEYSPNCRVVKAQYAFPLWTWLSFQVISHSRCSLGNLICGWLECAFANSHYIAFKSQFILISTEVSMLISIYSNT